MNEERYIRDLIAQGEHQQQDFKYKVTDAHKLAKSVSAFANTEGGRLLIGVRDDGHISGVRSEEEIYMMHAAAYRYCQPAASIKFDTFNIERHTLVIATIPPSEKKPVCAINEDGLRRAYIRLADENIIASPVHLTVWREQLSPRGALFTINDTERQLIDTLQQQPCQRLNQLTRRSRLPRRQVVMLLAHLIRFGLVSCQYDSPYFTFSLT